MSVTGHITIQLPGAMLYGLPVVADHDFDVSPQPDITVVNATVMNVEMGYGRLYNFHALMDERNMAPEGWTVAGKLRSNEYSGMSWHYDPQFGKRFSGYFKSPRTETLAHPRWDDPNIGGYPDEDPTMPRNESGFTGLPGGMRTDKGGFHYLGRAGFWWAVWHPDDMDVYSLWNDYHWGWWIYNNFRAGMKPIGHGWPEIDPWKYGCSARYIMDDPTGWYEGMKVTDPSGNVYDTVSIPRSEWAGGGVQVWTVQNVATTKFRNGDDIPIVTGNEAWENMGSAACCAYDNNEDNVMRIEMPQVGGLRFQPTVLEKLLEVSGNLLEEKDENRLFAERLLV